jgi:glycerol-3-phosphate dehydrogenase subunit B
MVGTVRKMGVARVAIEQDVLVVGGGLAGITAAIAAAETGADVRLASYKQPTLRHASGLVDVLGYTPDGEGPLVDPFEAIDDLPEGHPYERAGADAVHAGLDLFDDIADTYEGSHTPKNALLPTHGGTVKPTARYPAGAAAGVASDTRDTLLVGFERLVDFDAPLAAAHLGAAGAPFRARGVTVEFPIELSADPKVTRFAHLLDRDEAVGGRGRGVRRALAERVKGHLDGEERVGFPAVLGDDHPTEIRSELEAELGAAVFEVPMGPPSLPGIRLEDRLYEALDDAGVSITTGNPIVDYDGDGTVETVYMDRNGSRVPYAAAEFVLATGGLVGKGIDSDREGVEEPIFDCHVPHPSDRYEWFEDGAFDDHAFARFGVDPDTEMRPRDADGDVQFDNLRAAGSVLGGSDFAAEKSGSGVSLATGYRAGHLAGQRA